MNNYIIRVRKIDTNVEYIYTLKLPDKAVETLIELMQDICKDEFLVSITGDF